MFVVLPLIIVMGNGLWWWWHRQFVTTIRQLQSDKPSIGISNFNTGTIPAKENYLASAFTSCQGEVVSAIETVEAVEELQLYPIPAADQLNLSMNLVKPLLGDLTITNSAGKTIMSQPVDLLPGANRLQLNTADLASGFYFLMIKDGEAQTRQKFVINR